MADLRPHEICAARKCLLETCTGMEAMEGYRQQPGGGSSGADDLGGGGQGAVSLGEQSGFWLLVSGSEMPFDREHRVLGVF